MKAFVLVCSPFAAVMVIDPPGLPDPVPFALTVTGLPFNTMLAAFNVTDPPAPVALFAATRLENKVIELAAPLALRLIVLARAEPPPVKFMGPTVESVNEV